MTSLSLNQFLLLYAWFPLAALLGLLLLIARFYQNFSGEPTYFRVYLAPMTLFGAAAVRYSSLNQIGGDPLGDLAAGAAGLILILLCIHLYRLMMTGRK